MGGLLATKMLHQRCGGGCAVNREGSARCVIARGQCAVGKASLAMSRSADVWPGSWILSADRVQAGAARVGVPRIIAAGGVRPGSSSLAFDARFGVDQPPEVLPGQSAELAGFGAPQDSAALWPGAGQGAQPG
jgi:hypothetical protein